MREARDVFEKLALASDRLGKRARPRLGDGAAGLREALYERVVFRFEEQDFDVGAGAAQRGEVLRQRLERFSAAHIHAERHARVAGVREKRDQLGQELHRQVVDAVVARVFERVQRDVGPEPEKAVQD